MVLPNEGYRFAGWSHPDYVPLRGAHIPAQSGVMRYDTLTVYGNVELRADFELERYAIHYRLHGGTVPYIVDGNVSSRHCEECNDEAIQTNPSSYTIESDAITLIAPEKADDVFTGWTGSNGDEPQLTVTIPTGSAGDNIYYANYLYSGCEDLSVQPLVQTVDDRIWAAENELHIWTSTPGSIVRIYSMEGVLQRQQIIFQKGETKIKLPGGLYVVTLNNGIGQIVNVNY